MARFLALFALLMAQSGAPPRFVVPDAPDVMIKTRRMSHHPGANVVTVVTEIAYFKGARQRREETVEHQTPGGLATAAPRTFTSMTIWQCDERRVLLLNQEAKTYAYLPIEDQAAAFERLRAAAGQPPPRGMTMGGPVVTITVDAVDTGERRRFGNYVARRVVTTRTIEPAPERRLPVRVQRQDGWYVDVPPSGCIEWGGAVSAFTFLAPGAPDHTQFKQRGTARRGYPIEETNRWDDSRPEDVTTIELVELSESPLDPALFTIPPGYRAALPDLNGGYDMTKPDTIQNRLESYRKVVVAWAEYLRRNGLAGILPGTRPPARY